MNCDYALTVWHDHIRNFEVTAFTGPLPLMNLTVGKFNSLFGHVARLVSSTVPDRHFSGRLPVSTWKHG